jgi:hypothetical protein
MNEYEAAEMLVVGDASETILGRKTLPVMDNRVDENMFRREDFEFFDE